MKISNSLEQLARYNLQRRAAAGRVDPAVEKLKRFQTILEMFAGNEDGGPDGTDLSSLALTPAVPPSAYGRMMQALSTQLAMVPETADGSDSLPGGPETADGAGRAVRPFREPVQNLGEKERIHRSVARAAEKYNLPEALIKGVIRAESAYNRRAVSRAGAQGLMQLMPATARELGVTDAFDIDQNIDGGARYLRKMIDRFDGDVPRALAAYNAGPGTVERFKGKVPYRETMAYVDRVLRYAQRSA